MHKYMVSVSYNIFRGYLTGAATLEEAVSKAQWARDYYEPMYPGAVRIAITLTCERCTGHGHIVKGRKDVRLPKYIECPTCKGEAAFPVPVVA